MTEKDEKPKIRRGARLLGVRLGFDIDVEKIPRGWLDDQGYLLPEFERSSSGWLLSGAKLSVNNT